MIQRYPTHAQLIHINKEGLPVSQKSSPSFDLRRGRVIPYYEKKKQFLALPMFVQYVSHFL